MTTWITRRAALAGSLLTAVPFISRSTAQEIDAKARLAQLERENGGRLGVAVLNVASGNRIEHRADERFAMCSTFKFLAAACVLARVDRGEEWLDRRIVYSKEDLVPYSPVTEQHVGGAGMTVADLCEAAMTVSDNTAGNLLLASFGGPAGLTAFARSLGDDVTRLDRIEPELNEAKPGDPRDTTTPAAMLENMHKIIFGYALSHPSRGFSHSSRERLIAWLVASKTGDKRLRASLPKDWRVGDKTGSGANGTTNDIAVIWRHRFGGIIVTAYYAESSAPDDQRNFVLAEVGRITTHV